MEAMYTPSRSVPRNQRMGRPAGRGTSRLSTASLPIATVDAILPCRSTSTAAGVPRAPNSGATVDSGSKTLGDEKVACGRVANHDCARAQARSQPAMQRVFIHGAVGDCVAERCEEFLYAVGAVTQGAGDPPTGLTSTPAGVQRARNASASVLPSSSSRLTTVRSAAPPSRARQLASSGTNALHGGQLALTNRTRAGRPRARCASRAGWLHSRHARSRHVWCRDSRRRRRPALVA